MEQNYFEKVSVTVCFLCFARSSEFLLCLGGTNEGPALVVPDGDEDSVVSKKCRMLLFLACSTLNFRIISTSFLDTGWSKSSLSLFKNVAGVTSALSGASEAMF